MQEAEEEVKKMTDCLPTRRIRGKNGDEMGAKKEGGKYLLYLEQCVSDVRQ